MSANISVVNGKTEMFSGLGQVPWHGLGQIVSGLLTAKEAIEAAHLGWTVKTVPVFVNGKQLRFPTGEDSTDCWQGIIREDTGDALSVMKGRYSPIQNVECFDFLDTLAGEGNLKYETAGALKGGRIVWMMARYNGDIDINGDNHQQWLLLCTSHDGSYSLMVQWVTVRVVCANTLSVALKDAKNQVKIRHTTTWESKAEEARRVLCLTRNYFSTVKETLVGMNKQLVTPGVEIEFAKFLFPAKDEKEVPTRTQNSRLSIQALFNRPATGTFGQSRWDLLNAVTDYADHERKLRGDNSSRLESSLLGSGAVLKQSAYDYLTNDKFMADLALAVN